MLKLFKAVFTGLLFHLTAMPLLAEETFRMVIPIAPDPEGLTILQETKSLIKTEDFHVGTILDIPDTPAEAMDMLDEIESDIDGLGLVINDFRHSRKSLLSAIARLGSDASRYRAQLQYWNPLLQGNLRLLHMRSVGQSDSLTVLIAIIVLEKQLASLGTLAGVVKSGEELKFRLEKQEMEFTKQGHQLLADLSRVKDRLRSIRLEALQRIDS